MNKNSFLMYTDYKKHFDLLSDPDKVVLMNAIFNYALGEETELEGAVAMAFSFIKAQMDRDQEKYVDICEKRRIAGAKGGAPKGNRNASKQNNQLVDKTTKNNQNNQLLTKQAKQPDTDTDTDNDNDNDINRRVDYQLIADMYNNTCVSFPRLTKLSDSRKKTIRARLNTYSIEEIQRAFDLAEKSDFLKGKNNRNWSASFDWLMKDTNIAKVLDGNYDNKPMTPKTNSFNNFKQNVYDFKALEEQLLDN